MKKSDMSETMEERFARVCDDGTIPGVVLMARSKSDKFNYSWHHGKRSVREDAGPLLPDTLLRIASATKLIVSICAMQCVDRGLIRLDDDVRGIISELKEIELLSGFDQNDEPMLGRPKNRVALRQLLSHSSGFTYDVLSPELIKWFEKKGLPLQSDGPKLVDQFSYPLDFEPGTRCIYSPSIDWAGRVVEHLTKQRLEEYMQANICAPLNLQRTTFYPQQHPDILAGHAEIVIRNENTGVMENKSVKYWDKDPIDCFGGSGCYTTAQDLFTILSSLLLSDMNNPRQQQQQLLSPDATNEFLAPQLTPEAKSYLAQNLKERVWFEDWNMGGSFPAGSERDHSLCGMYLCEDLPVDKTPRRPGAVSWAGMPNVYWVIDRTAGMCTLYVSQVEPTWDKVSKELLALFEQTMYERMHLAEDNAV